MKALTEVALVGRRVVLSHVVCIPRQGLGIIGLILLCEAQKDQIISFFQLSDCHSLYLEFDGSACNRKFLVLILDN